MPRALLSAVLALSVLLSSFAAALDASYTFTTIDAPHSISTAIYGINTGGQIVGSFRDAGLPGSPNRGFLKDGTRFTTIDVPGAEWTEAHGINTAGQIVGTLSGAAGAVHSFLKDGATFTTIDAPGATQTLAFGINDDGRMVGFFNTATGETHGFVTDSTGFATIDVPGAQSTQAFGISNNGHIVGQFRDATGDHGFVTDGAKFTTINVPDGQSTQARGINMAGEIVGTFSATTGRLHGFQTDGATFTTIDVPGAFDIWGSGINIAADLRDDLHATENGRGSIDEGRRSIECICHDTVHPDMGMVSLERLKQAQGELSFRGIVGIGHWFGRQLFFGDTLLLEGLFLLIPRTERRGRLIEDKAHGNGDFGGHPYEKDETLPPQIATTFFIAQFIEMGKCFGRF
jgi:probable HAF family extracellular repeat protein